MLPEAWEAMRPFACENFGNPASAHAVGRKARQALEDARERIALCLDASAEEVVFTSGATEANNLAIFGLAGSPPGHILSSPMEHPCVVEPLRQLAARRFTVSYLPENVPNPRLVVAMLVNHETGASTEYSVLSTQYSVLHCDAAQAVGKIPVSFRKLGATTLSLSAHKFGGPKGIGALLVKKGTQLVPQLFGGHQQQGRRPGTEPVALAVGMATALEIATRLSPPSLLGKGAGGLGKSRDAFIERLHTLCPPIVVNSPTDASPYILNVSFPGCRADVLLMKLDLAGIACSTGSACSSGSLLPSPVLQAMGVSEEVLRSAMRFSFASTTNEAKLVEAATRIAACVKQMRAAN